LKEVAMVEKGGMPGKLAWLAGVPSPDDN